MAVTSNYIARKFLGACYLQENFEAPKELWLALFNTDPQATGTGVEVTGGGYQRYNMKGKMSEPRIVDGKMTTSNTEKIEMLYATTPWTDANFYAFYDAPTGGNLISKEALLVTAKINVGENPRFDVGELTISMD